MRILNRWVWIGTLSQLGGLIFSDKMARLKSQQILIDVSQFREILAIHGSHTGAFDQRLRDSWCEDMQYIIIEWNYSILKLSVVFSLFIAQSISQWLTRESENMCKVTFVISAMSHLSACRTLSVEQSDGRRPCPGHLSWQAQHLSAGAFLLVALLGIGGAFSAPATQGRLCKASLSHWAQNAFGAKVTCYLRHRP